MQLLCRQCLLMFRRVTGLSWEEVRSGHWKVAHSQCTILRHGAIPGKGSAFQGGRLQGLREFPVMMTMPLPWDGLCGRGCLSPALLAPGQASGPPTIVKSSLLREQRMGRPDLAAQENFLGALSPEGHSFPATGECSQGKAEVWGRRPVFLVWDTTTFSRAWIFLEDPCLYTLP